MSAELSQMFRFGVIGACVTLVYVIGYTSLHHIGFKPFNANAIAYCTAVLVQFFGQTLWAFRRTLWDAQQGKRFFATIAFGIAYSSFVVSVIGPAFDLSAWIVAGVVAVTVPVINYIFFRLWVYRSPHTGEHQ